MLDRRRRVCSVPHAKKALNRTAPTAACLSLKFEGMLDARLATTLLISPRVRESALVKGSATAAIHRGAAETTGAAPFMHPSSSTGKSATSAGWEYGQ